jgi:hypothetical protein
MRSNFAAVVGRADPLGKSAASHYASHHACQDITQSMSAIPELHKMMNDWPLANPQIHFHSAKSSCYCSSSPLVS